MISAITLRNMPRPRICVQRHEIGPIDLETVAGHTARLPPPQEAGDCSGACQRRIENACSGLNGFRRKATRHDRLENNFAASIHLAAAACYVSGQSL
jgi:hypothetical protein